MPKSDTRGRRWLTWRWCETGIQGSDDLGCRTAVWVWPEFIDLRRTGAYALSSLSHAAPGFFDRQPGNSLCGCSGQLTQVAVWVRLITMNGRIGRLAPSITRGKIHNPVGGESRLLHLCDGPRSPDPLVRSAHSLTTTCGHAYCFPLRSFPQRAPPPQASQAVWMFPVWSHKPADNISIHVHGPCLCTETGSAWGVRSSSSSKHVHMFASESCPAWQGEGSPGGPQTVKLSRDRWSAGRQDLHEPY